MTKHIKPASGFTLIELMIVVAIIGVIASIAYPSYTEQVRKARRADLTSDLLECAGILERRFTVNRTYGPAAGNTFCDSVVNDYYDIVIVGDNFSTNGNSNGFLATATPSVNSAMLNDSKCSSFTLTHLSSQDATNSDGYNNKATCWRE